MSVTRRDDAAAAPGDVPAYCRQIEAYLCQKNDGHLIRVVGPSFELVSKWANDGVPLRIAYAGIDRYFERYYRQGPRRRPVRIDFCEADVLDVFDEWRRATGISRSADAGGDSDEAPEATERTRGVSLPAHLKRVLTRLTSARVSGRLPADADAVIDQLSNDLDRAQQPGGVRGAVREAVLGRLSAAEAALTDIVRRSLQQDALAAVAAEADEELSPYKSRMAPDQFARARQLAIDRLIRARLDLPTIAYV